MITNNISWSFGATPNKRLEPFGAFICSHSQSDLTAAGLPLTVCRPAASPLAHTFALPRQRAIRYRPLGTLAVWQPFNLINLSKTLFSLSVLVPRCSLPMSLLRFPFVTPCNSQL